MNKTVCLLAILCSSFFISSISAQNILVNSNMKTNPRSKHFSDRFSNWWSSADFTIDSGYKAEDSVKTTLTPPAREDGLRNVQLSQGVEIKEAGKYIMTVNFKQDARIERVRLLRLVKAAGQKDDYQLVVFEKDDLPEPGNWGHLIAELDLPAGRVSFAYQAYGKTGGQTIWFDNPQVIKKLEE